MTEPPKSSQGTQKQAQNAAREARLAAALRENLKRRKAQIREKERAGSQAGAAADKGPAESDDNG